MKVLHVYATLRQQNGVTAVIMNYLRHIPRESVQIDLLVYPDSEPDMVALAESLGAKVFFMPKLGMRSLLRFSAFLRLFFADHPYDIVHSHFNQIDTFLFPAARAHGVRHCISHSHNTKLSDYRLRAIRNRLMCWNIARNADTLAACSEAAGVALYGKAFATSPRKLILRNGIDVAVFSFDSLAREKIRTEFHVAPNEILLGHVGSFRPQKNHEFMLRLLKRLLDKQKGFKMLFVGGGGRVEAMRQLAVQLGVEERVIFAGSRADVSAILSGMDFFLLPSLYEGFGISLLEAQISGLPCFASTEIPREVACTNLVRFLPLSNGCGPWVDSIVQMPCSPRKSRVAEVQDAGYDIRQIAPSLGRFYHHVLFSPVVSSISP